MAAATALAVVGLVVGAASAADSRQQQLKAAKDQKQARQEQHKQQKLQNVRNRRTAARKARAKRAELLAQQASAEGQGSASQVLSSSVASSAGSNIAAIGQRESSDARISSSLQSSQNATTRANNSSTISSTAFGVTNATGFWQNVGAQ